MLKQIIDNREKALKGVLSFMPYGLDKLGAIVPGQIPELPTIITGSTSAGKSSLARFLYIMKAVELAIEKHLPYKLILFNLEDSNQQVEDVIRCYLYYKRYDEIIDVLLLNSRKLRTDGTFKLMTPLQLERVKALEEELQAYLSYIVMFDNKYTNIEIYTEVIKEASKMGDFYYESKIDEKNTSLKKVSLNEILRGVEFNKFIKYKEYEDLMVSVMVDNANKLQPAEDEKDLYTAINKMNSYACIGIIKILGFHYLGIHQQNAISTSIDHIKFDYFLPKENNLGDSNFPSRDARQMIGVAQPFKFNQKKLGKYDLTRLKGYFRVINIMKNTYGATGDIIFVLLIPQACTFITLPKEPDDEYLEYVYELVDNIKQYEDS